MLSDMSKQQVAKQRSRLTVALSLCHSPKPDSNEFAPTENPPLWHSAVELRIVLARMCSLSSSTGVQRYRGVWALKRIPCATQCCNSGKGSVATSAQCRADIRSQCARLPVLLLLVKIHQVLVPETLGHLWICA